MTMRNPTIATSDAALVWHLQHNHFPPVFGCDGPDHWTIRAAREAIEAIAEDDLSRPIEGDPERPATAPAYVIADAWHLDGFLEEL